MAQNTMERNAIVSDENDTSPGKSSEPAADRRAVEIRDGQRRLLCDPHGKLIPDAIGWSRRPLHISELRGPWLRQKRWDAWGIGSNRWFTLAAVMNLDYVSLAVVYLFDRATGELVCCSARNPLGKRTSHCATPNEGRTSFSSRWLSIEMDGQADNTQISVRCQRLAGRAFEASFQVESPLRHESLNLVVPWSQGRYHFTSKQACLPASGQARFGQQQIDFAPEQTTAWLDFARGIWPYASGWNWAMCSARHNGRLAGFNLGSGWTRGSGVNENAVYLDGRVLKLRDEVRFDYSRENVLSPWRIRSVDSDEVDLTFAPAAVHAERLNLLIIRGSLKQLYGTFSGRVVDDSGQPLVIDSLFGVVEEHAARW